MSNNKGFTLVELMISLAMTGIIVAAVYSVYTLQQKTSTAQDQVVEMQQNIRAAVLTVMREMRMAGYDQATGTKATITAANATSITFDLINDSGTLNTITYGFAPGDDVDSDGIVDNTEGIAALRREINGGGLQPLAENIEAIEFQYKDKADAVIPAPVTPSNIRSVIISILARATWGDAKFVNDTIYSTASGVNWDLGPDNFRRRLLITTVYCRNMGVTNEL